MPPARGGRVHLSAEVHVDVHARCSRLTAQKKGREIIIVVTYWHDWEGSNYKPKASG